MSIIKYSMLAFLLPVSAFAQTNGTYLVTSSSLVSPGSPTTIVEVWAAWDDPALGFYFGAGDYDLVAGEGVFISATNILNGPHSSTGVIAANVVSRANNGQINLPPLIPLPPAMLHNPILLATYQWTTSDFSTRTVSLHTRGTTMFIVGDIITRAGIELFPSNFSPGSGTITVVPAPAAWLALALPLVGMRRRR